MIELTEQQVQALGASVATPPRVRNPKTNDTFVLLRLDEYQRLTEECYDDSPWTRDELHELAWRASGQDGDDDPDKPPHPPDAP